MIEIVPTYKLLHAIAELLQLILLALPLQRLGLLEILRLMRMLLLMLLLLLLMMLRARFGGHRDYRLYRRAHAHFRPDDSPKIRTVK